MWNKPARTETDLARGRCDAALSQYLDTLPGVAYVVDDHDRIVAFGRTSWNRSAFSKGALELTYPNAVVGKCVFDVIADEETRIAYRGFSTMLREGVRPRFEFPLRGEDADRASLQMLMTPIRYGGGRSGLLYHVVAHRSVGRGADKTPLFQVSATPLPVRPLLRVCTFCQFVHRNCERCANAWGEADSCECRAQDHSAAHSHGICSECYAHVIRPQLDAFCDARH